jgi:RNA polymerase sigma factor (sigma-70 family)
LLNAIVLASCVIRWPHYILVPKVLQFFFVDYFNGLLDKQLLRLEAGGAESRRAIIEASYESLRQMAERMLRRFPGVGRWSEADDVLHNALIRLYGSLAVVKPASVGKFYGLAALQIRRELIDLARRYFGPLGIGSNHGSGSTDHLMDAEHEPPLLAEWAEFHAHVERLPRAEREVFGLLWYDGLLQVEAAKVLGISLATFKRRWQSVRILLQKATYGHRPA